MEKSLFAYGDFFLFSIKLKNDTIKYKGEITRSFDTAYNTGFYKGRNCMDFKDELNRVSRTFDDIIELENQEQMKLGIEDAELDYKLIKDELIEKARQGKYQIVDGKRRIILYYNKSRIKGDFNLERSSTRLNKSIFNSKGSYATLMKYSLINDVHYDNYMKTMTNLCQKDGIRVKAVGMYNYHDKDIKFFDIPGAISGFAIIESELSVCLECIIEYGNSVVDDNKSKSNIKDDGTVLLRNMGYSVEEFIAQKNQCDITAYKDNIEYGVICKVLNRDFGLEREEIKKSLLDCIKGIEYVGDDYTDFFLKSYFNGQGFSNVKFIFDSDTTITGSVSCNSIQYKIKYYCEEGFSLRTNSSYEDIPLTVKAEEVNIEDEYMGDSADNNFDNMEGHEFESFCAKLLEENGYKNVEVTRGSGDQGIDIIAYRDDIKYGIQCKCYSSDIGNKAVQEVYAGKAFYHCHVGIVLTNRYFTKSAIELAERNGIILWNRDKLLELINK